MELAATYLKAPLLSKTPKDVLFCVAHTQELSIITVDCALILLIIQSALQVYFCHNRLLRIFVGA